MSVAVSIAIMSFNINIAFGENRKAISFINIAIETVTATETDIVTTHKPYTNLHVEFSCPH